MKSYATPWDAVGMSWYAMGGTMAMPRKIQVVLNPAQRPINLSRLALELQYSVDPPSIAATQDTYDQSTLPSASCAELYYAYYCGHGIAGYSG